MVIRVQDWLRSGRHQCRRLVVRGEPRMRRHSKRKDLLSNLQCQFSVRLRARKHRSPLGRCLRCSRNSRRKRPWPCKSHHERRILRTKSERRQHCGPIWIIEVLSHRHDRRTRRRSGTRGRIQRRVFQAQAPVRRRIVNAPSSSQPRRLRRMRALVSRKRPQQRQWGRSLRRQRFMTSTGSNKTRRGSQPDGPRQTSLQSVRWL